MASSSSSASTSNPNAATGEPKEVVTGYPLEVHSPENVPVVVVGGGGGGGGGGGRNVLPPPPPALPQLRRLPPPDYEWYAYQQPPPVPERRIFCRALTWALIVTLVTSVFWFLIWLVVHPTCPHLQISSGELSKVSVSNNNTATASCNIKLILTNPNPHLNAIYNQMEISLLYTYSHRVQLSEYYLPTFVQPRRNQTMINSDLSFYGVDLGKDAAEAMKQDLDEGSFTLGVKVLALVQFRNGRWKTRNQLMKAYCRFIIFGPLPNNNSRIIPDHNGGCVAYLFQY